jgi:two-component sensor histidine kinase
MNITSLFDQIEDDRSLAQIVMETVREPLLVLDNRLHILAASASFHRVFQLHPDQTYDEPVFALDGGAWDIPALHTLLEQSLVNQQVVESFQVVQEFPRIGTRIFLLHARTVRGTDKGHGLVLLGFEDVTQRRAIEEERSLLQIRTNELLQQKEVLLKEMQHRIVNSLQIIASILMLKARAVTSEETREHLKDAHRRVMSVAAVQQHLHSSSRSEMIEIGPYLSKLSASLTASMIGESRPVRLEIVADSGTLPSADAVSLGLIVTELVINALKYAFPDPNGVGMVTIRFEAHASDWMLTVADNGIGRSDDSPIKDGLGASLVAALAHQLEAKVITVSNSMGMSISVAHATFTPRGAA